ncbi:threonine/serine exporter family protein [Ruminococcus sp.]|uniref:threonine/serine ThrE exporter family protein n=1 Tax=Ruminococcus sp. TaxID=41978 RepID=UPI002BE32130|nr:threonine/serine exporter family protein [Ruminococcus sp.]HNZ98257.1 threonine/serine exporter family protein [Ruminococcus sp.]HOH88111.1 threonine/serine exporter family protein [Ruminococcus sp.]
MSKFRKQHMSIDWHEIVDSESMEPAINASLCEKATLVGRIGLMMLSVGTAAWRVRASMNKLARALDITCNADIGLLSIEYTCIGNGETYTNAISLNNTGVNTDKLNELENFADGFAERVGKYSVQQFHMILDKFQDMKGNYKAWNLGLASALACCAFTFLLGGGIVEMICAFFGAGIGNFVRKKMLEKQITLFANVAVGVASACCTYVLFIKLAELLLNVSDIHQAGYICSMLFVIPGFPLITGGMDLAKLDLRSGIERVTYALLIILVATLTGWVTALIFNFHPQDFESYQLDPLLRFAITMITSFCGVYGFSLMFNSTRKMAATAGLIGRIANTLRLELIDMAEIHVGLAAFIGALTAGLLASAIHHWIGYPRITLTVPSIVIMVPGMFMYKGIYYIALNDIATGGLWLTKAVLIVAALPLGLIFARIITDKNFRKSS